jgi:hypothetical protein
LLPEKPIPKKHTQGKSHDDGFVDEMERERETFSTVSVTHCLPGGTTDRPLLRDAS